MSEFDGIVYVVDGAGGSGFTPAVVRSSMRNLPYEVVHFRWGTGYMRIISDLTNKENIRKKANELSGMISAYRNNNRTHPIYIVAKSAGALVALLALSSIEAETVERVILLSPAVSPSFPLGQALHAVRHDMISFWSQNDVFFLGLGTFMFGTADGVHGKGAGLLGFSIPSDDDPLASEYGKLRQVQWQPSMIKCWNFGDHSGNSMPSFVRRYIVPLIDTAHEIREPHSLRK